MEIMVQGNMMEVRVENMPMKIDLMKPANKETKAKCRKVKKKLEWKMEGC